jgi:phosphoribosyl 1,2-cyclic phosphate phosphodiesterase
MLTATILGSGTSSGVPTIACTCPTCLSTDMKDKRLRPSIWLHSDVQSIVIDTSSDFREQCLRHAIRDLDAIVYTHHHFDHIAGFDDLRAFNFKYQSPVRIFLMKETLEHIRHVFSYAFPKEEMPESGIPVVEPIIIDQEPFRVDDLEFRPLPLRHGRLRVNGYRIGDLAYCTDCNAVTDLAIERMTGVRTLILDALRFTHHPTHFTLDQAIEVAKRIGAETTYFTHIAHEIKHQEVEGSLPEHMHLAYDGLTISVDTDA